MDRSTLRALALVWGIGFAIALPLLLLGGIGIWLDTQLNTRPLFMLVGLLVGLIAAGATISQVLNFRRDEEGQSGRKKRRAPRGSARRSHDGGTEED